MASLKINDLVKAYGHTRILHGIDLEVRDGEFVVLVGPSGCGKSTLLRMIAGLDDISSGELWIGDKLANTLPPQGRNISMVFQSYALFPHMSVRANVGFGPRIRREPKEGIAAKVAKAAATLNLTDYLDRFPRQLSGGQRQRVAMGRTIVREPDLFLFDEPLSNLDAKLRVQMRTEIKALHQALKTTIVYVTHDQIEAMTMADRIVVMNAGRIEQVGAPLDLYDRPANRFVAGFLGSPAMSFIPGILERGDGAPRVRTASGVVLPVGETNATSGQAVEIGIRPERYRVAAAGDGVPFEVKVVEPTGSETHVFGSIAGTEVRCVLRERVSAEPGSVLPLTVDPADVHVFDAGTGERL
ncbi:ABC transporter ATP-binding protein [Segnochrobactrum spirostomi]|uniref:sn-glycerol-3-phosphate ABC transporter ATP-binding protein UgpC n=1 Tax=Segnochrobactrum spirostomi TaxID=2608987 RepID=A0A6A7Y4Q2_9HYPH|nr:sn-glycerol-3-phosphate ABC transporter ATP-binding protein UgpC [Segnochrobactrum spirostomi]MQT14123.1 sn-glycerol-3-phosphate ABC transporter ATP-binding protein UgpC [Segnochrobactrum spirostomi]